MIYLRFRVLWEKGNLHICREVKLKLLYSQYALINRLLIRPRTENEGVFDRRLLALTSPFCLWFFWFHINWDQAGDTA